MLGVVWICRDHAHDLPLQGIGVLEFIDHDDSELFVNIGPDVKIVGKQVTGEEQQVVELEHSRPLTIRAAFGKVFPGKTQTLSHSGFTGVEEECHDRSDHLPVSITPFLWCSVNPVRFRPNISK